MKINFGLIFLFFSICISGQNAGDLDTTFSQDGKAIDNFGFYLNWSRAIATDGNRIYIAGGAYDSSGVAQTSCIVYTMSGEADTTFSSDGKVQLPSSIGSVASDIKIQPDGKILIFSQTYNNLAVSRLNHDGSFDTTFGDNGVTTFNPSPYWNHAERIILQQDGKILIAGYCDAALRTMFVARLNTDGTFDNTYGNAGFFTYFMPTYNGLLRSMAIQPDGKALIAISEGITVDNHSYLLRIDTNGILDTTFNGSGSVIYLNHYFDAIAVTPDGKILIAGTAAGHSRVYRFTPDGQPDDAFGANGYVDGTPIMQPNEMLYRNGKIILIGTTFTTSSYVLDDAVSVLNADGTDDTDFGNTGMAIYDSGFADDNPYRAVLQDDGKILVTGNYNSQTSFMALRFIGPDFTLGNNGYSAAEKTKIYPNPSSGSFTFSPELSYGSCIISVKNILGQTLVWSRTDAGQPIEMELNQPTGLYFITTDYENGYSTTLKLIRK